MKLADSQIVFQSSSANQLVVLIIPSMVFTHNLSTVTNWSYLLNEGGNYPLQLIIINVTSRWTRVI